MNAVPRIPHFTIVKAPGLLPMQYRLVELAEELEISPRIVREWMEKGLPYTRDARGHLWISGPQFSEWVSQIRSARRQRGQRLAVDEAYCLRCRKSIKLTQATRRLNGKQIVLNGQCPDCAGKVNRGIRRDQPG